MNDIDILRKERDGMKAALAELDEKLSHAAHQRHTLEVLLAAVEDSIAASGTVPVAEQLELPFPENAVAFPTLSAN